MNGIIGVAQAMDFAARKHAGQRRKGLKAEPYVNHLTEVALLLARATQGNDPGLVMAGLLHDTVEDTNTTRAELIEVFGEEVAALVSEVTDDKSLPSEARKRHQVEAAPRLTVRGRMLKIADKIANLHSLSESPPVGWSAHRKRDYIAWAREVVSACGSTNELLEDEFEKAAQALEH